MKIISAYKPANPAPGNPNDGSVYSQFREDLFPRLNFAPPSIFFFRSQDWDHAELNLGQPKNTLGVVLYFSGVALVVFLETH